MNNNSFDLIIWKLKEDQYKCHLNNCHLSYDFALTEYLKDLPYASHYMELIENKKTQMIVHENKKIIVQFINEDTFSELRFLNDNSMQHVLSCISHKIRNPLTNIVGILTLVDDFNLDKSKEGMSISSKNPVLKLLASLMI